MTEQNDSEPRPHVAAQIDENLKRVYGEVAREGVPDRFRDLIAQLKAREVDQSEDAQ
ncbi:hypothetical protein BCF33_1766 [Hasllibacter halocynthiae]|uniref:Anti-sigma factor NepR domain-containing protein n=1 Tax=Hasllibacter halocynthiae TaxID=595589 RepID=A0A2T0X1S0_9RHOB|nr:NepR family anti-sigma factor [Hasllibacter halocynthiae]PRY92903.1 hypothetical protein BCF33_1766 [Hasllibacter halocynthiae]